MTETYRFIGTARSCQPLLTNIIARLRRGADDDDDDDGCGGTQANEWHISRSCCVYGV